MNFSDQELIDRVIARDLRAVARLITLSENRVPRAAQIQAKLFSRTGRAHVVGVTGSPGAGKSTLVDALAVKCRALGKSVAVVAVDPTSPFSGGAILGDRIRMSRISEDPQIYIRSMATRGSLGGISRATIDAVRILDAAGFDLILVETVGVGQAEVDIIRTADTCLVVLVPGMGDSVQAIKAGILEIADVFVINKADREGADLLQKDLRVLLSLSEENPGDWKPQIVQTVATESKGVDALVESLSQHQQWLTSSAHGKERRRQILEHTIKQIAQDIVLEKVFEKSPERLNDLVERCLNRTCDPYSAAKELIS